MCQTTTYVSAEITEQLARDLVGLNQVAVRCSYAHGTRLGSVRYFSSVKDAEAVIESLFFDLDVKELWLGVVQKHRQEMKRIIFFLGDRRDYGHTVLDQFSSMVDNIIFS